MKKNTPSSLTRSENLHPNTLFHLTEDYASLLGILENGFRPSYALENGVFDDDKYYVPSVCFSDLRVSELSRKHLDSYGPFGIGMTKDWGRNSRVNPVFYIIPRSFIPSELRAAFSILSEVNVLKDIPEFDGLEMSGEGHIEYVSCFIKRYSGILERKGKPIIENFYFADEREWRHIPASNSFIFDSSIDFKIRVKFGGDYDEKHLLNKKIEGGIPTLKMDEDDIKYLIVPKEKDALRLFRDISKLRRFSRTEILKLRGRVLTNVSIYEDF